MPKKISEAVEDKQEVKETTATETIKEEEEVKPTESYDPKVALSQSADIMRQTLEKQNQVSILIPLERGESSNAKQSFCINGYRLEVPKGIMTMVPEQIASMIAERYNINTQVRNQSLEFKPREVQDAVS